MEELLKKIKSVGYWKVIIRPTKYEAKLIRTLPECSNLIVKNKVELRGWDYPHIDTAGIKSSSEISVHSYCDWSEGPMYEYWRFYQTGQFVHYFSMREDLRMGPEKIKEFQSDLGVTSERFLSILSTIYSVTEIFTFAKQLFPELKSAEGVEIIIELHGVKNRTLAYWDAFTRYLSAAYTCEYPSDLLTSARVVSLKDLIKSSNVIALDVVIEIFHMFNWPAPPRELFEKDQNAFLERRL